MTVEIYDIIKTTVGGFHSWVKSNVGIIRKPNNNIRILKVAQNKQIKIKTTMMTEFGKTSLLIVATIFSSTGASVLATDPTKGSILLLIGVGVLVLRGFLKARGIETQE